MITIFSVLVPMFFIMVLFRGITITVYHETDKKRTRKGVK